MDRRNAPPRPSLAELRRATLWFWLVCERCLHRTPTALAPWIIRWGPNASSDLLRRAARCGQFGAKGAVLQHPSWGGSATGWEEFPR